MYIRPRKWADFQHYKTRTPPWIKLHRELLDNRKYHCLPIASKALAPMLWLLASEDAAGLIRADDEGIADIAFRLRMEVDELRDALKPLIDAKFFEIIELTASKPIAGRKQTARPESEGETEGETDSDARAGERFWSEVWAAFQTWGRLPDTSTETRAKAAYLRVAANLPPHGELLRRIRAQGERLREGGGKRGGWATAPHNWLERDRGWEVSSTIVGQPDESLARAAWHGEAGKLIDALGDKGHGLFVSYFFDAKFEPGPVPRITVAKPFVKSRIEQNYMPALRKAFGDVTLEVAA